MIIYLYIFMYKNSSKIKRHSFNCVCIIDNLKIYCDTHTEDLHSLTNFVKQAAINN